MADTEHRSSVDNLPTKFGTGWISGVLSVALGMIGLFAVLCFHFPHLLTHNDIRPYYADFEQVVRALLHVVLVAAFLFGISSVMLRQVNRKQLIRILRSTFRSSICSSGRTTCWAANGRRATAFTTKCPRVGCGSCSIPSCRRR